MDKPKINFGDFAGLKEKGVAPKSIETVKNAISLGAKFNSKAELIKVGLTQEEADIIADNASLTTTPTSKPVTVRFLVTPTDLGGYSLGVIRTVIGSTIGEETSIPIIEATPIEYTYDDVTTGNPFTVFVKSPGGDFVVSAHDGAKQTHHSISKENLGKKLIEVSPVAKIKNAKDKGAGVQPVLNPVRLKGRLICGNPGINTEKLQIIIEVATKETPTDADFFPVCFADTETDGYFFTSQLIFQSPDDFKNLTAARAKVALSPSVTIPIKLDTVARSRGKLPERLILFFERDKEKDGDKTDGSGGCGCGDCSELNFYDRKVLEEFSYYTVVRTTEPLIETYEISDVEEIELEDLVKDVAPDLSGVLTGLTASRGVLSTFLSRNKTITKGNLPVLLDSIKADKLRQRILRAPSVKPGRVHLDNQNEIDWDEKPTIYQAVSIAHGHLLHFKQEWFHDGYSLGDLLYSLPLAPGQKKQIVVLDWERKESAANIQELDFQESLFNSLSRDRDVSEVARATLDENIRASSEASTWGIGAGLGIGAIIPSPVPIGALLGVGGGGGGGSSSARQSASRTTTASSQQSISDRTVQAGTAVRSQRSTVIQTVGQGERFQVSAESVANYNHCHALTIQYFEVLRHFEARTRLAEVKECLFIPLKMSPFTPPKALRWRDLLFRCLKKRFLAHGFDALYRIEEERESATEDYYDKIGLPKDRFAEEELEYFEGELSMEFQITRPANDDKDEFVEVNWAPLAFVLGNTREFYDRFLRNEKARDEAFARHAGPRIAREVLEKLQFAAVKNVSGSNTRVLPVDATLLSEFRNRRELNISLRMRGRVSGVKREDIDFVIISIVNNPPFSDLLRDLINTRALRIIVHSGAMRYRTKNLHEYLFNTKNIKNDLTLEGDNVQIFCPLSAKALRRPRQDDVDVSNELLHHLNENLEYYHQCIWSRMDAQRRFMLMDGVIAPGMGAGRSVASVVENKLIGIVGNCLVMPVAPGFRLDPIMDESVDLYEHYFEEPLDPIRISLPTKGVFAEAVMGKCNSCEFKEEERFWRWEESPIPDNPTAINAVTPPTPERAQVNLTPNPFPQPVITLQNAPQLPDPQGFSGLTSLLGTPNIFKDLTGLSENQKNALAAFQASLKTAEQFGEGAQALTGQAVELSKFNKLTEMLGKGQISKDEFKELINKGQESPELKELKGVNEAVKKEQITPEAGERLNNATLKKAESEASKKSDSVTEKPALKAAIDSFVESKEGSLEFEEGGSKVNITKGTGGGNSGSPTIISDTEITGLTDLNKGGVELFERISELNGDITYEVFASRKKVNSVIDFEDAFVMIDVTLNITDRASGVDVKGRSGAPLTLQLKAEKTVPPDTSKVLVGSKVHARAVSSNQSVRNANINVAFFKGDPKAEITPDTTLFLFPFPLSDGTNNEFVVDQPPSGGTGSGGNSTHVGSDPVNTFAVDFRMPSGTDVFAMRDGVVVNAVESNPDLPVNASGVSTPAPTDADKAKANVVRVRHADGTFAEYVHLKKDSVGVAVGDKVTAGSTKLGQSGNSGFSTGPHLHVVVLKLKLSANNSSISAVSVPFKFKGANGAGVTPGKGEKFKRV